MDATDFVAKWRKASLQNEMQVYADHLDDLCRLANHPTRLEFDPGGERFAIQKSVTKLGGSTGAADAWFRGHFAIEYKGKGGNLEEAYRQLLEYRDNLENPPLLIVSDLDRIVIRTNYTGRTTRKIELSIDSFASGEKVGDTGLTAVEVIRKCFHEPLALVPEETTAKLTEKVATQFQAVAVSLRDRWGHSDMAVARFLTKLVFCMFASDVDLLPRNIISEVIDRNRNTSAAVASALSRLFVAMNVGGDFGSGPLRHFNGGLFADPVALEIDSDSLDAIRAADQENWADVEPSIFGTLFERIIDEKQRRALGKHYTSREDIELLIEPVIMWPLLREWGGESAIDGEPNGGLRRELEDSLSFNKHDAKRREDAHATLQAFIDRLGAVRVLDPACGSGNFLYIALEKLRALEHEAIKFGLAWDLPKLQRKVHPRQLFGIEKNEYAHQLASTVVWIGYLQSKRRQGDYSVDDPVLEPLDNIQLRDAILDEHAEGEASWPEADFVVGNPPFLGGKRLRRELGGEYVDALFKVWDKRVRREADLCCYWFEKARAQIEAGNLKRAGLLATQAIRGGANRDVLKRIKESGDIFFAVDDREWMLDGAAVQVSMVGFDDGSETRRVLLEHYETREGSGKGQRRKTRFHERRPEGINSDLTAQTDSTSAARLRENAGISFMGDTKVGPFEIPEPFARELLAKPNPHGKPNSDVVRPWANGLDITRRPRKMWIVDFPPGTSEVEAAKYEAPFAYIDRWVKKERAGNARRVYAERWWIHAEARPEMRRALAPKARGLVTPNLTKYRFFVWLTAEVLPDHQLIVFARDDDYFFGVLQSHAHEVWARATGTQLREAESGFRYTPTTCFETFPLPWAPGKEPTDDLRYLAIADAARELNEFRETWLNPPANADGSPALSEEELKKRTLTNLYNERPAWLANAHEKLDRAVFAAYGWEYPLEDQEILSRLLAENLRRAALP
ncbi:MAG: type IIL restriction-modification enzyme MmeI [Dehalococcoidia bacterium]